MDAANATCWVVNLALCEVVKINVPYRKINYVVMIYLLPRGANLIFLFANLVFLIQVQSTEEEKINFFS